MAEIASALACAEATYARLDAAMREAVVAGRRFTRYRERLAALRRLRRLRRQQVEILRPAALN